MSTLEVTITTSMPWMPGVEPRCGASKRAGALHRRRPLSTMSCTWGVGTAVSTPSTGYPDGRSGDSRWVPRYSRPRRSPMVRCTWGPWMGFCMRSGQATVRSGGVLMSARASVRPLPWLAIRSTSVVGMGTWWRLPSTMVSNAGRSPSATGSPRHRPWPMAPSTLVGMQVSCLPSMRNPGRCAGSSRPMPRCSPPQWLPMAPSTSPISPGISMRSRQRVGNSNGPSRPRRRSIRRRSWRVEW